ncbi:MAG TPA: MFS transporter [Methylomirabilota bacterium]|nr:MFS transporter [Methylomirabilota bacterium]
MTRVIAAAGAALVSLDSVVNIAFPAIAAAFGVAPDRMRWVIICYVFTYALTALGGGALADRVGHRRVFIAGVALSGVAFALGGLAPSFASFLGARVVQGVGGGLVYGTAPGLVTLAAPASGRARALASLNAAIGLAFASGPLVAGILVDTVGWRSVFHVRVPLAALALALALRLPASPRAASGRRLAMEGVVRGAVLRPGVLAFCANAGIFAVWLLGPFYLVTVRGLDASAGGALFMLTPLGTAVAAPLAGRLTERVGPGPLVAGGLALEAVCLALLGAAGPTTALPALAAALAGAGFGLGVFQVPNMSAAMSAFGATQQGVAGGIMFFSRTLGTVFGVATLAQLFAARRAVLGVGAFNECFVVAALGVAAAAVLGGVWARRGV